MITRFQRSYGFRLWRWKLFQVELWFCPHGEHVPTHRHPMVDSTIVFLFGRMLWWRSGRTKVTGWRDTLHAFPIASSQTHGLQVLGRFGLFLNLERWQCRPSSVAHDFA